MDDDKLYYVTEVGVFENIDIDDPTAVELEKKKKEEMEKLIEEAIEENKKNMKGK
jgi:hypothetical protein